MPLFAWQLGSALQYGRSIASGPLEMGRLLHVYRKARCVLVREAKRAGLALELCGGEQASVAEARGCIAKEKEHKEVRVG